MIQLLAQLAPAQPARILGHDWRFAHPHWLLLAWLGPALMLVVLFLARRTSRKLSMLGEESMLRSLAGPRRLWSTRAHAALVMLIVAAGAVTVARPQSDPREVQIDAKGRDVVFMVDVSRSMQARDVAPDRLGKSKLWINDLVDELGNDRVGLVAFAGSSSVLSPLTNDRLFFKLALEELNPESVQVGGTNIGDAIRKTMDLVFADNDPDQTSSFRDIVLISDGEDQESLPVEAARQAGSKGVRIITIGIGSDKGAPVPWDKDSGTPRNQEVTSKLESGTLKAIAAASPGGVYLEVGTGTIDLAQVYQDLIATADQRTIETTSTVQYTERFMIFASICVVLIIIDIFIGSMGTRKALT